MQDDRPEQPLDSQTLELEPRGAFAITNEAFAIYFTRFKSVITLNAIAQLPVAILTLLPVSGEIAELAVFFVTTVILTFAIAATIYVAGQHYVHDRVNIGVCYGERCGAGFRYSRSALSRPR